MTPKKTSYDSSKYLCNLFFFVLISISLINFGSYLFKPNFVKKTVLGVNFNYTENSDIVWWENMLENNPDYFPGWIKLGYLYVESGDVLSAKQAVKNAEMLFPNDREVNSLDKAIGDYVMNNL